MVDFKKLNVLMVGTGEYTTGWTSSGTASTSDKKVGVVGLVMFDLRRRGKVNHLSLAGTNGTKFPAIREHLQKNIAGVYRDMDVSVQTFPGDNQKDPQSCKCNLWCVGPIENR
ncbi:hypothetical protein BC936DRAFT_141913 [Jimgerdemannia flammicorona]|uniref:Uncharacterized protein n=1 Tax=Jimgerdemannia flammicorona TaxID=994334 RepID=A0A433A1E2_9FUNG|nr:hypothetical protein BC936DRAFT_141913 [Jimgerdemannia flammicorona]